MKNDYKKLSNEFLSVIQSTKNISEKTFLAYHSDLKDFCIFLELNGLDDVTLLEYVKQLAHVRHLKDRTISRKLIQIKQYI